jgi:hypothetical protein
MKRLFTFGCSLTWYKWPTWADILGKEFDYFENWGQSGAGNQFIFNSIVECLARKTITANDTFIIMWTSVAREDRYVDNQWLTPGNIYTQNIYDHEFVKKFADNKGYLIRDLALIDAVKTILDSKKIRYIFLSMVPISNITHWDTATISNIDEITGLYKKTIDSIRPSMFETIFNNDWNRPANSNIPKELDHPVPMEHLAYIDKIMPEFIISDTTRNGVADINRRVIAMEDLGHEWLKTPARF